MKIERAWISIFIPSLISSLFKASKALLAIVNSTIRNARKKLVKNEYTKMNAYEVEWFNVYIWKFKKVK